MSSTVQSENRSLLLGVLTGAAGVSITWLWWRQYRKHGLHLGLGENWSSGTHNQVQDNQGAVMVLQGSQLQILEKLGSLLKSVEELKDEVKFLKETIPKLEEQIKDELRGKNDGRKVSPQHRSLKRKKSETSKASGEYPSSEEAESEGGYITAHTDTEAESEDEPGVGTITAETDKITKEEAELRSLLQQTDTNHNGSESEKQEGFRMLLNKQEKYGNKVEFLWRLARAYSDMFYLTDNVEEKKSYAADGKSVAEKAVELDDKIAASHRWYAIMCGYMSEYENVQNKIKNGYLFKEHLDKAIHLHPEDPLQYYLLGRWCYAVSQLSWIERKVAATLFGIPPTSTVQEALQNFLKAEEIHPGYSKYNYVFLAKCYKDLGQKALALKYYDEASAIPSITKEDIDAQKDLEALAVSLKQ
ncbi:regulator of microtubule dynamics protein 2 [Hyla sarda]|uniref:regulator of microtubule dynamics protein 2 n=1 Tax=Hyla sarda TaxID=327740 RepID=UPI0024C23DA8|nr:regulator of microtubule dynamics protein 2 [Hyla sarda]XP_056423493.1 regulator of microtubule dynamics protein 2 [Hyla sarda]XP_056423494.1 regulator of microtubule dynamics protein 2 [Hyla sarda]XP_056423496.1 regulator of microtubule dynamics protein 2 [Hyla sarda]XP_056423497.1 regulator of microtubule dynamics protein 2 [Hyla sarda]XP_056423498.1 regulator of microtubule dynamics protein 2 [Hyla sarda]